MSERMLMSEIDSELDRIILKKKNVNGVNVSILLWLNDMTLWVYLENEDKFDTPIYVKNLSDAFSVYDIVERLLVYREK